MAIELTTADNETILEIKNALQIATLREIFPEAILRYEISTGFALAGPSFAGTTINFAPFSSFGLVNTNMGRTSTLSAFQNAEHLISLQNAGTQQALILTQHNFSDTTLNELFSALPVTTKTATINVTDNPGAATCDPTIATAKGYTVITS